MESLREHGVLIKDIRAEVKTMKIPFASLDIADLAAQYLHERGMKIWK